MIVTVSYPNRAQEMIPEPIYTIEYDAGACLQLNDNEAVKVRLILANMLGEAVGVDAHEPKPLLDALRVAMQQAGDQYEIDSKGLIDEQ